MIQEMTKEATWLGNLWKNSPWSGIQRPYRPCTLSLWFEWPLHLWSCLLLQILYIKLQVIIICSTYTGRTINRQWQPTKIIGHLTWRGWLFFPLKWSKLGRGRWAVSHKHTLIQKFFQNLLMLSVTLFNPATSFLFYWTPCLSMYSVSYG